MIKLVDNYNIDRIIADDSKSIHKLMTSNVERFKRYFPKTLEENQTPKLAKKFALKKAQEFENQEEFLFTIKDSIEVIGLVYIKELDWKKKQGEFAYCVGKGYGGIGLITNAVKSLVEFAFKNLDLEVLQIIVHKQNLPSVKVAQNSGFSWQKTLLKEYTPPNELPLDMELYELYKK